MDGLTTKETFTMDPGSPNPVTIPVLRRKSLSRGLSIVPDEDSCSWVCTSALADMPAELERIAITAGVALHSVDINGPRVKCLIRVPIDRNDNAGCFIRATTNNWESYNDYEAKTFTAPNNVFKNTLGYDCHIPLPASSSDCTVIEFAICYRNNGAEYWDNNMGQNHKIIRNNG